LFDVPFLLTCVMVSAQASPTQLLCPACRQATAQRFLYSKNGCDILQCAECGLGRAQASVFDPGAYYTGDYFSGGHADGYADYRGAEPVLRREFANTVDFIRKYRASGRLLDVGCAYGFFLQEARPYFDVAGIEIAEEAATFCRKQSLRVLTGMADEYNLAQLGMMDVITLLDVLEHLPSPHETLALCTRYLSPGGVILITTGDFASHSARVAGARWRLMTPPQHLWYFTLESVERMSRARTSGGMVRSSLEDSTDLPCRLPDQAYAGHAHRRHLDHERRGASSQLIRCNAHCVAQERVTIFLSIWKPATRYVGMTERQAAR
jgi:SAM-dependent methyltransferase